MVIVKQQKTSDITETKKRKYRPGTLPPRGMLTFFSDS